MTTLSSYRGATALLADVADTAVDHIGVGHIGVGRTAGFGDTEVGRIAVGRIAVGRLADTVDIADCS